MAIKSPKPEEIVFYLRQVKVLMGQGMPRIDAIRQIGVTEQTYPDDPGRNRMKPCKNGPSALHNWGFKANRLCLSNSAKLTHTGHRGGFRTLRLSNSPLPLQPLKQALAVALRPIRRLMLSPELGISARKGGSVPRMGLCVS